MKYKVTVTGGAITGAVAIEPGETLEAATVWLNADKSPRVMDGSLLELRVFSVSDEGVKSLVVAVPQSGSSKVEVPAPTTANWAPGTYHAELVETTPQGVVGIGSFPVAVVA